MKTYELSYIASPEITTEEAEAKSKEIGSIIQSKEGTVIKQSSPVAKTLSYPIKKHASGFWSAIEFQLEPEKLTELKETLAKDGKIVRSMIIIKEPVKLKKGARFKAKTFAVPETEKKTEFLTGEAESPVSVSRETPPADKSENRGKVELKDIEHELDELLGE